MNEDDFDIKELVEKESNIWACIYRGINRKKDNNEFDEEEEPSGIMMMNSMNDNALNIFKDNQLIQPKQYPNLQIIEELNDSSKLEEDDSLEKELGESFSKYFKLLLFIYS